MVTQQELDPDDLEICGECGCYVDDHRAQPGEPPPKGDPTQYQTCMNGCECYMRRGDS